MPYIVEHAWRLKQPSLFSEGSVRRMTRYHNGKAYDVIIGKIEGKSTDQAFRYKKDLWSEKEARKHCESHNGILFEPAKEE